MKVIRTPLDISFSSAGTNTVLWILSLIPKLRISKNIFLNYLYPLVSNRLGKIRRLQLWSAANRLQTDQRNWKVRHRPNNVRQLRWHNLRRRRRNQKLLLVTHQLRRSWTVRPSLPAETWEMHLNRWSVFVCITCNRDSPYAFAIASGRSVKYIPVNSFLNCLIFLGNFNGWVGTVRGKVLDKLLT